MRFSTERILTFRDMKRAYIRWVYKISDYNKTEAARLLGVERSSLYRMFRIYKIEEHECVISHTKPESEPPPAT